MHVRAVAAVLFLLACGSACRIFMPWRYERLEACAATLPLIREDPQGEYRILGIVQGNNDEELVWEACQLGADAVYSGGIALSTTTTAGETATVIGDTTIKTGHVTTKERVFVRGVAVKFVR